MVAIDSSGSIGNNDFYVMLGFVKHFVTTLNIQGDEQTRVGVETFNNDVDIKFHLNEYGSKMTVVDAISFPYNKGGTNTAEALRTMREVMFTSRNGDRSGFPNIGVIVTDGESNDRQSTFEQSVLLREEETTLLVVSIAIKVFLAFHNYVLCHFPHLLYVSQLLDMFLCCLIFAHSPLR